jgi:hypothetical protein
MRTAPSLVPGGMTTSKLRGESLAPVASASRGGATWMVLRQPSAASEKLTSSV